jgi:predicted MPP superfamily phosphohydrolase
MARLAWVTDVHLDFLDHESLYRFHEAVVAASPDALLVGGDTATAPSLEEHLAALAGRLQRPLYFVLGNHNFYRGSIHAVRQRAEALNQESPWLRWLPAAGVVS